MSTEPGAGHPSGFSAGPNIEWVPQSYFVDAANTLTVNPYVLVNARLAYDDDKQWSAYLEGRNLANTTYVSSVSITGFAPPGFMGYWPGNGRGIYAGVRYRS